MPHWARIIPEKGKGIHPATRRSEGEYVASGTIDGAAPIKFCSFFLTLIEEKGTINVLGSIETHIKIV